MLHLKSLPYTPQHNPQAERAIGQLKQAAEIGPAGQPIESCRAAEKALLSGHRGLEARPRAVLGGLTTTAAHARWPR